MSDKITRLRTLKELQELLEDSRTLTSKEYLGLLLLIQKNFALQLAIGSFGNVHTFSSSQLAILEKVHWMIDSAESKVKREDPNYKGDRETLEWEYPDPNGDEIADA